MANWHGEQAVGSTHEWYTPPELFAQLDMVFDLDPVCPASRSMRRRSPSALR